MCVWDLEELPARHPTETLLPATPDTRQHDQQARGEDVTARRPSYSTEALTGGPDGSGGVGAGPIMAVATAAVEGSARNAPCSVVALTEWGEVRAGREQKCKRGKHTRRCGGRCLCCTCVCVSCECACHYNACFALACCRPSAACHQSAICVCARAAASNIPPACLHDNTCVPSRHHLCVPSQHHLRAFTTPPAYPHDTTCACLHNTTCVCLHNTTCAPSRAYLCALMAPPACYLWLPVRLLLGAAHQRLCADGCRCHCTQHKCVCLPLPLRRHLHANATCIDFFFACVVWLPPPGASIHMQPAGQQREQQRHRHGPGHARGQPRAPHPQRGCGEIGDAGTEAQQPATGGAGWHLLGLKC